MPANNNNPLGRTQRLRYRVPCRLIGVELDVRTNDTRVADLARAALDAGGAQADEGGASPMVVSIIVHPGRTARGTGDIRYRVHAGVLLGSGPGVMLSADRSAGRATAFIAAERLDHGFRRGVLECLGLFLATRRDRVAVHAATLVHGDTAALLLGPSGSGKSTLAYALCRTGCRLLAEDAVYLATTDGLRLWGQASGVGLRDDVLPLFPELARRRLPRQQDGKSHVAMPWGGQPRLPAPVRSFKGRIVVCALRPRQRAATRRLSSTEARSALDARREPGFDLDPAYSRVASQLADAPVYGLRTDHDTAIMCSRVLRALAKATHPASG